MNDNNNPYEPPKSDVTPVTNDQNLSLLPAPRSLPAGAGISWLSESWPMVKSNLGTWVLITLALFAIQFVLGIVPVAGDIVSSLIGPVMTGGILMGVRAIAGGETLRFDYLFEGFKQKFGPLVGLGALTLGIMFLFGIIIGGAFVGMNMDSMDPEMNPAELLAGANIGLIAVGMVLLLFVMMLFWFATQLVALNDVPVFQALTMSFKGCLHNPLSLLVYSLAILLLLILGAIPLLLGLLVVVPWLFSSMYLSYKQIFLQ